MALGTSIFNSAGSSNWVAPFGVTAVQVQVWGGGGGGGGTAGAGTIAGGGGGGGAYAIGSAVAVAAGNSYAIVVGAGGTASATGNGGLGATSYFGGSTVLAGGGAGGKSGNGGGGAGGTLVVGDLTFAGGNGAAGATRAVGGGGGGGAGTSSVGGDASGATGGTGGVSGGHGGNATAIGTAPGGGGGGRQITTTAKAGAIGQVILTYNYTPNALLFAGTNYGTLANYSGLDALTAFTVEGWYYGTLASPIYMGAQMISDGITPLIELQTDQAGLGQANGGVNATAGGNNAGVYSTSNIFTNNSWQYVAYVYDNAGDKKVHIYYTSAINEPTYNVQTAVSPTVVDSTGMGYTLGTTPTDPISGWKGKIGGFVRIWNRALGSAEMGSIYNLTLQSANETGLISNFNFIEQSGTVMVNEYSSGGTMNLVGAPPWTDGPATTAKNYGPTGTSTLNSYKTLLGVGI